MVMIQQWRNFAAAPLSGSTGRSEKQEKKETNSESIRFKKNDRHSKSLMSCQTAHLQP